MEAGESQHVGGKPGIHSEILSQKKNQNKLKFYSSLAMKCFKSYHNL